MAQCFGKTAWLLVCSTSFALGGCHGIARESTEARPPAESGSTEQHSSSEPHSSAQNKPPGAPRTFRLVDTGGVGFDDLLFSRELGAVLAPAGATGCVHLFDSADLRQTPLCGISRAGKYAGGHGEGTTSADSGKGFVFAIDRTSQSLAVIDPKDPHVVASAKLAGGPDYVRWVANTSEIWVTEPDQEQIEVFSLSPDSPPKLSRSSAITVKGGPESLVIDAGKSRAFTHLWEGRSAIIDVTTHSVTQTFPNSCRGSRGIALDGAKGFLFVGCAEGKAAVLDADHGGKILSSENVPNGVDIISMSPMLRHLYVPAASDGSVTVFGVGAGGALSRLGTLQGAKGTHCATGDDHGRIWVCAPDQGALLVFDDPFPAAAE